MESFLRVPFDLAPAGTAHPVEHTVWRPLLDLGPAQDDGPSQALSAPMALHNMLTPADRHLPVQSRPGPALRERLTEVPGLRAYAVQDPADLPPGLRTEPWQRLCEWTAAAGTLDATALLGLAGVLAGLGLYGTLAALPETAPPDDPRTLLLRVRVTHARSALDRTPASLAASVRALESAADCAELPPAARLGAATTLVVLRSQSRLRDTDAVARHCRDAAAHAARLDPDGDWRDILHLSTYWRAVSFAPFLAGDLPGTLEQLDLAETWAARLPDDTPEQRWVRRQNHHPLMETRTKTAVAAGDLDAALRYATALRDGDPLDGKTHIQLGDVLLRRGERPRARESYLAATILGAPYHALAWSKAAQAAHSDQEARYALMCAHRDDPRSVTPLALQEHTARRLGDDRLAHWAAGTARTLLADRAATPTEAAS